MSDLISRQAAINEVARFIGYLDEDMIRRIQIALNRIIPAEPEPEREKGEWNREVLENTSGGTYYVWRCSVCGFAQLLPLKMNYCPNCGSDMRGDNDE